MENATSQTIKPWWKYAKLDKSFTKIASKVVIFVSLQALVDVLITLIDNFLLGHSGKAQIAGEVAAGGITFVVYALLIGAAQGGSVFGAQYYGAKNKNKFQEVLRFRIFISLTLILLVLILAFLFSKFFIQLTIHPAHNPGEDLNLINQSISYGEQYLKLNMFGFIPYAISYSLICSLRDTKKVKIPFYITCALLFIKLGLAPLFVNIFFKENIIEAVSFLTICIRILQLIFFVLYIFIAKWEYCYLGQKWWYVSKTTFKQNLKKTCPLIVNEFFWSLAVSAQAFIYAKLGINVILAFQGAWASNDIIFAFFTGLSGAGAVLIGNTLGANDLKKAQEYSLYYLFYSFYLALILSLLQISISYFVPYLINANLPYDIKLLSTHLMLVLAIFYSTMALNASFYFILRAGGDIVALFVIDTGYSIFIWLGLLFVLVYFAPQLGALWIYFFANLCQFLRLALSVVFYRRKKWIKNLVKH